MIGNKRELTIVEARWREYLGGKRQGKEVWSSVLILSVAMMVAESLGGMPKAGSSSWRVKGRTLVMPSELVKWRPKRDPKGELGVESIKNGLGQAKSGWTIAEA